MSETGLPVRDAAEELVEGRRRLEIDEAHWLEVLAGFDREQLWSLDGCFTAAEWLEERCGMARSTAYEKLHIAHELRRRPDLAKAMAAGELSYSHVRLITRICDPMGDTDAILLQLAREGSVRDLERAVRRHVLLEEQDRLPGRDRVGEKGAFVREVGPGMDQLCLSLPKEEMAEVAAAISAFLDRSAADDDDGGSGSGGRGHRARWDLRRAEALQEIGRAALGAAGKRAAGADRYMTHVIIDLDVLVDDSSAGVAELIDGTPITAAAARKIACDSTVVAHLVRDGFEPLALGTKTKTFTDAQKRAIKTRDRHRCRMPGCERTIVDCHHIVWASKHGRTDIANGTCVCDRHHTMIHNGDLVVAGDANATLTVHRRDGTLVGFSAPPSALPRI